MRVTICSEKKMNKNFGGLKKLWIVLFWVAYVIVPTLSPALPVSCEYTNCTVTSNLNVFPPLWGQSTISVQDFRAPGVVNGGHGWKQRVSGGLYPWNINGVNLMFSQWSWFRLGENAFETALLFDAFSYRTATQDDTLDIIRYTYDDPNSLFGLEIEYDLSGLILEKSVRITNKTLSPLKLTWFEYFDVDLHTPLGDKYIYTSKQDTETYVVQGEPLYIPGVGLRIMDVCAEDVTEFELGSLGGKAVEDGGQPSILDLLNDSFITSFDSLPDQWFLPGGSRYNLTFAFEFTRVVQPGVDTIINTRMSVSSVPEPSTLVLFGSSLIGVLTFLRKRSEK